jgi:hypothetical protein
MDNSLNIEKQNIIIIKSSYTEAQKKAIYKYRSNNIDKINQKRRETYHRKKQLKLKNL